MKPDTHTRTEADAAAYAALAGRDEAFGDNPGDQSDDLLDVGDARLRADPWDAWICWACGYPTDSQPETCPSCNYRNYGVAK